MTIDELARAAGLVVSTVRLYQNRGLLAPPVKQGRVGVYGEDHLQRLHLIAQLQARGFSLAGIKELFEGMESGQSLRTVLGLGDGPSTWSEETPETMRLADLVAALPQVEFTTETIARVLDLGLVSFGENAETVTVHQPSFLRIGQELAALGVPGDAILDEYLTLRQDTIRIAERFTSLFRTTLWEPFAEAGMPAERIAEMIGVLERLGPLAEGVVVASLRQALQALAETFAADEAARLGVPIPLPGASLRGPQARDNSVNDVRGEQAVPHE